MTKISKVLSYVKKDKHMFLKGKEKWIIKER